MKYKLKVEPKASSDGGFGERLFSFAVVDLDRSESYPQNFVCMLPVDVIARGKTLSAFQKLFGDNSVEQAKTLLTEALESEGDSKVRAEIERRLKRLTPEPVKLTKCSMCGKQFNPGWARKFRKKYCPECMTRKYAGQS